ncbi:MAG: hypothetical protein UV61_C0006G0090 [Candidatus Gottesmanbacteria bacterium GW2011_GWB1_43_11]|uniref:Uncharacterized protein n=1 Tax=Candidatus Gottesmanbacteria bacterium GW2011_GWB1_43_11 TaxID=1618446 RepID=A0A0G1CMX5_9BACT|nr:MAG: hypothetical protein UV04_C0005G0089 [Candidatus Gottesmanbacteria bacterium GW2011_GWA2_42_16]KKS55725.1 MAG: hypothetical protein UV17_C0008G0076 [Candidatus Gottesmanbacteria bacterium GW2011_GWA1_42_26]KKS80712.1 MAG: hypothetical protein UV55_C0032G0008 [Candidatus Gottesmanbacteria bacterium GW2011_GWC1_43_10]KKS86889.1 MAG: hypothetical protein UV61_C0006G0090 [Candidatus Gottesmanbacteria bacterium GW2011_GWB1_43_11]OGG10461.1 MAG: hypothetical protein A2699_03740 [Candidatus Go
MLKNIIAPVQAWLLSQNRCVGCGKPLVGKTQNKKSGQAVVTCICKRIYVFDDVKKRFRRALVTEI